MSAYAYRVSGVSLAMVQRVQRPSGDPVASTVVRRFLRTFLCMLKKICERNERLRMTANDNEGLALVWRSQRTPNAHLTNDDEQRRTGQKWQIFNSLDVRSACVPLVGLAHKDNLKR